MSQDIQAGAIVNRFPTPYAQFSSQLDYSGETGVFVWKVKKSHQVGVGNVAGFFDLEYCVITVCGQPYSAHRLAWLLTYGEWPTGGITHLNGDGHDNRICNLALREDKGARRPVA